jgi:hypothetical protein
VPPRTGCTGRTGLRSGACAWLQRMATNLVADVRPSSRQMRALIRLGFRDGAGGESGRLPAANGADGRGRSGCAVAAAWRSVVWVRCDPSPGNCDRDGSPTAKGCGWYIDILHTGGVETRYCHQLRHPTSPSGSMWWRESRSAWSVRRVTRPDRTCTSRSTSACSAGWYVANSRPRTRSTRCGTWPPTRARVCRGEPSVPWTPFHSWRAREVQRRDAQVPLTPKSSA